MKLSTLFVRIFSRNIQKVLEKKPRTQPCLKSSV